MLGTTVVCHFNRKVSPNWLYIHERRDYTVCAMTSVCRMHTHRCCPLSKNDCECHFEIGCHRLRPVQGKLISVHFHRSQKYGEWQIRGVLTHLATANISADWMSGFRMNPDLQDNVLLQTMPGSSHKKWGPAHLVFKVNICFFQRGPQFILLECEFLNCRIV